MLLHLTARNFSQICSKNFSKILKPSLCVPKQTLYTSSFVLKTPNINAIQKATYKASPVRLSEAVGGHDHTKHWTAERALSVGLLISLPAAIAWPNSGMEYILALMLTLHSHWGVEAIVVDYIRPSVVGNALAKASVGLVYALSAATLGGLAYFIYTDVGLVNAVKLLWKL